MLDGWRLKEQKDLTAWRWLGYVVSKSAGSKVKKPEQLMELPLIDEAHKADTLEAMKEYLRSERNKVAG